MVVIIFKALAVIGAILTAILLFTQIRKRKQTEQGRENLEFGKKHAVFNAVAALVANFLDTGGIGAYGTNSAFFKFGKSVNDADVAGTLTAGCAIPMCLEAFLFLGLADIDVLTLVLMMAAAVAGAMLGARFITKLNTQGMRLMLGIGLLIMSIFMLLRWAEVGSFAAGGSADGLTGGKLVIAVVCNFIFGILMNIGVGLYAPCMAICAALGMSVTAALPIVFVSCAMLMTYGNAPQFIKADKFDITATVMQAIFGSIGAAAGYFLIKNLPVRIITIVIIVVIVITAVKYLTDYKKGTKRTYKKSN